MCLANSQLVNTRVVLVDTTLDFPSETPEKPSTQLRAAGPHHSKREGALLCVLRGWCLLQYDASVPMRHPVLRLICSDLFPIRD